jgi:hypothetical protein
MEADLTVKLELDEQLFQSILFLMQKAPIPYEVAAPVIQGFLKSVQSQQIDPSVPALLQPVKRKRGRPPKAKPALAVA